MYSNYTSCKNIPYYYGYPGRTKRVAHDRAKRWVGYLKEILTPEYSASHQLDTHRLQSRWLGIAKALFWTGASIVIGLILATICK